jgi:hypothetical protein
VHRKGLDVKQVVRRRRWRSVSIGYFCSLRRVSFHSNLNGVGKGLGVRALMTIPAHRILETKCIGIRTHSNDNTSAEWDSHLYMLKISFLMACSIKHQQTMF